MHARIVAVSALTLCARAANTVVDLGYASYRGVQSAEFPLSVAFLGVPYAEPPVGDLRFRGTVPLNTTRVADEAGDEAVDVTQYPNFCIQGSIGFGDAGGAGSEDCLKVNIYAPANATADSSFPVLVYIHGGGYSSGNPRNWPFDHWIQQSPNIVVVSVYYRLKSLGFLSHPSFAPEDLNGGIRDQLQALRWVNEHIAAFGGDPSRVTINGESAGGGSVEIHLVAKEGQQLFHGAIPQSVAHGAVPDPERTVELFEAFVAQVGCPNGTVPEQVACLRNASVSAIARAQDAVSGGFSPVVDGSLITDHPTVSINNGDFLHVPLLVGATSNESFTDGSDFAAPLRSSFPTVTNETLKRWEAAYPVSQFGGDVTLRNIAAAGEVLLRCPREIMSTAWREDELPAFSYRFNQPNPSFGPSNLTQHAAENWWMFLGSNTGTNGSATFTEMTPAQTAFAQELIAYWISFVRTADPSTERLARSPAWPLFDPTGERSRMVLQMNQVNSTMETANVIEEENTEELGRCAFVASIAEELEN